MKWKLCCVYTHSSYFIFIRTKPLLFSVWQHLFRIRMRVANCQREPRSSFYVCKFVYGLRFLWTKFKLRHFFFSCVLCGKVLRSKVKTFKCNLLWVKVINLSRKLKYKKFLVRLSYPREEIPRQIVKTK